MIFAAAAHAQPNMTLGTFIFSVASGLTVVLLTFLVTTIRRFLKQHAWLIETVNTHSEAIELLLEERRPAARARPRPKPVPPRRQR